MCSVVWVEFKQTSLGTLLQLCPTLGCATHRDTTIVVMSSDQCQFYICSSNVLTVSWLNGFVLLLLFLLLLRIARLAHSASNGSSKMAVTLAWLELELDDVGLGSRVVGGREAGGRP